MYVIKKLKLNKFVKRPLVSNRVLSRSMGEQNSNIISKETSDCYDTPSLDGASKLKALGLAAEICKTSIEKHKSNGESDDLVKKNAKDY